MNLTYLMLIGMVVVMTLTGVPLLTSLLLVGVAFFAGRALSGTLKTVENGPVETYGGNTLKQHVDNWEKRIRHYLPDGLGSHPQTNVKTYGPTGAAIFPVLKNGEPIGYEVNFLIFDMKEKTTHTNRMGHIQFLDDEIEDALNVAFQFFMKVDELAEALNEAEDNQAYADIYDDIQALFINMYQMIYPEWSPDDSA